MLICKHVRFYAQGDELAFFEWLGKINAIQEIKGISDEIHLIVEDEVLDDESLRELIAIFTRYDVDLGQLSIFKNKENEEWFYGNNQAFWRRGVFGEE